MIRHEHRQPRGTRPDNVEMYVNKARDGYTTAAFDVAPTSIGSMYSCSLCKQPFLVNMNIAKRLGIGDADGFDFYPPEVGCYPGFITKDDLNDVGPARLFSFGRLPQWDQTMFDNRFSDMRHLIYETLVRTEYAEDLATATMMQAPPGRRLQYLPIGVTRAVAEWATTLRHMIGPCDPSAFLLNSQAQRQSEFLRLGKLYPSERGIALLEGLLKTYLINDPDGFAQPPITPFDAKAKAFGFQSLAETRMIFRFPKDGF